MKLKTEQIIDIICDADFETKLRGLTEMTRTPRNVVKLDDLALNHNVVAKEQSSLKLQQSAQGGKEYDWV